MAAASCAVAHLEAEPLDTILSRMDANAKKFRSVTAAMQQADYNAVLKESTKSDGDLHIRRSGSGFSGLLKYNPPDPRVVSFIGRTVRIYYPNSNVVEQLNAGGYLDHVSEFLLFGTSGETLKKTYSIAPAGSESIGSTPATHLVLTPKSAELGKMIAKLEIWIPEGESYPIQEKATEPSQNAHVFSFTEVKINPRVPDSAFEFKIPPGAKVINHK
jgi:outer membrane lipoprotein-sorting protein